MYGSRACILRSAPRYDKKLCRHVNTSRAISINPSTPFPPSLASTEHSAKINEAPRAHSRIASSLGGIAILSAAQIAQKRSEQGTSYKPDLSYLKRRPESFAGQLAANTMRTSASTIEPRHEKSTKRMPDDSIQRPGPKAVAGRHSAVNAKVLEVKGTDREMEKITKLGKPPQVQESTRASPLRVSAAQGLPTTWVSTATRISAKIPVPLEVQGKQFKPRPSVKDLPEMNNSPRVSPRNAKSLAPQGEDITYDLLENGGDEKEFAESITPDIHPTNLAALFRRRRQTRPSSKRLKRVEVLSGDHLCHTPNYSAAVHDNMSPLKHARHILSKNSQTTLVARKKTLEAITSMVYSTGKAISKPSTS